MTDPNLLAISVVAFVAVFLLLSLLAVVMRLLTSLFPEPSEEPDAALPDAAMVAAVTSAAALAYPGTRVTEIKESR
jgi:Na+-transporting methylmalonyl-CoA/oxaloacetate decarboxylase gamma subunit